MCTRKLGIVEKFLTQPLHLHHFQKLKMHPKNEIDADVVSKFCRTEMASKKVKKTGYNIFPLNAEVIIFFGKSKWKARWDLWVLLMCLEKNQCTTSTLIGVIHKSKKFTLWWAIWNLKFWSKLRNILRLYIFLMPYRDGFIKSKSHMWWTSTWSYWTSGWNSDKKFRITFTHKEICW